MEQIENKNNVNINKDFKEKKDSIIDKNTQKENHNQFKILNIDNIDGSTFKTKRKSFISEINPHLMRRSIQKEQYIWFGVYDELLRKKCILKALKKCRDTALPLECAAIHMEKYKVSFRKNFSNSTKIYMYESQNSVIFLKLYLITKNQFFDILKFHYGIEFSLSEDQIFKELQTSDSSMKLNSEDYDYLKCLGDLDNIFIYSLLSIQKNLSISPPSNEYLRNIFIGLKKSFNPYSEYLIIYYLYRLEGIKNFYDINQLTECFFKTSSKDPNSSSFTNTISSNTDSRLINQDKNLVAISEENENNSNSVIESNSPSKKEKDNETVKCSTCNASQFLGTPEKDNQLNQYSYIFDLHHLPIFDENTGEFFWTNNEANWKSARDSILKSEELNGKTISLNHGSIVSLSTSFINNDNSHNCKDDEIEKRWNYYRKEANSNTFINDLSNLLKNFEDDN